MTKTITFNINLGESEWNANVGAWRCDVLHVAGAEVVSIHTGSVMVDARKYTVEVEKAMITPPVSPVKSLPLLPSLYASIKIC